MNENEMRAVPAQPEDMPGAPAFPPAPDAPAFPPQTGSYPASGALLPAGTYPAHGAPGAYQASGSSAPAPRPAAPPRKARRVGTLTMALCLIVTGAVLLLRVFMPGIDVLFLARLSPIVLVLLGFEMIIASIRFKEEKLRFDFLSAIVCVLLIGGSLTAAAVPEILRYEIFGDRESSRLEAELEQSTAPLLKAELPVSSLDWYVGLDRYSYDDSGLSPADLNPGNNVQVQVYMPHEYQSAAAFAKDCHRALELMLSQVPHINYASFFSSRETGGYEGDVKYALWLNGISAMDQTAEQLAEAVEAMYWYDGYYMDEWSFEEALAQEAEAGQGEADFEDGIIPNSALQGAA